LGIGYKRADRVGDVLLKEISQMILKEEIKDPRVKSVVLTNIKVTDDLSMARIFFTVMGDAVNREEILVGLRRASGFVRRELSKRIRMRRVPNLQFEFDAVLEQGYRIDDLLREAKVERS
jgi:ribosome-binding factor A